MLIAIDDFYLLKIIYDCFENWPTTIYRGLKVPTCGLFCVPTENFMHDRGDLGNNGKTMLQCLVAAVAGDYFYTIEEAMLTSKPPHPSQPNAALMALMGRRCFGTPEVEDGLKIQAAWLKKLADPSTRWGGKEPYGVAMRPGVLFRY